MDTIYTGICSGNFIVIRIRCGKNPTAMSLN
jgi:hypothetical protein